MSIAKQLYPRACMNAVCYEEDDHYDLELENSACPEGRIAISISKKLGLEESDHMIRA